MRPDDYPQLTEQLCRTCHAFGERGWCLATSGNFSVRIGDSHCMITQSGREKSSLSADDLMICDFGGIGVNPQQRPSAETPLHTCLYKLDAEIHAVLHTHSVAATVLSRAATHEVAISGFEMQKGLNGMGSHEEPISIAVFDNSQDMQALAELLRQSWQAGKLQSHGFLIRGHGLYGWGRDVKEAQRHIEGLEFLFECLWRERIAASS
jgi:methylthioribulose-1-phosphate dehydratase